MVLSADRPVAAAAVASSLLSIWPPAPSTVIETGLPASFLEDLALKTIHYGGPATLDQLGRRMGLSRSVVEEVTDGLRGAGALEAAGGAQPAGQPISALSTRLALSGRGEQRAAEALSRSRYGGVAPVTMEAYAALAHRQALRRRPPSAQQIAHALSPFVLAPEVARDLARVLHAGRPALIYGDSGNGKTAIIEAFGSSFSDAILMPASIYTHGHLIRLYDPATHERFELPQPATASDESSEGDPQSLDRRWLPARRPLVAVSGPFTLQSLELRYDQVGGFHVAPPHLKAQDGLFVVDDFGRQPVAPGELLQRWMTALEHGVDLLTLHDGEEVAFPFELALLFVTNLEPSSLADEASLRRIPYKVRIAGPGLRELAEIARRECARRRLHADEQGIEALVQAIVAPGRPAARSVFARDLISIIEDGARFAGTEPELTPAAIAEACRIYFVSEAL